MLWNIERIVDKGEYSYAVIPEHPNANKSHYVLLHRAIMENYLGRLLTADEIVHHKDHNKKNNNIENLELMDRLDHLRMHGKEKGLSMAKLICPWCKMEFEVQKRTTFLIKQSKYNCTCCSPRCRGKLYQYIQKHGVTPEIQRAIDNNLVDTYTIYPN